MVSSGEEEQLMHLVRLIIHMIGHGASGEAQHAQCSCSRMQARWFSACRMSAIRTSASTNSASRFSASRHCLVRISTSHSVLVYLDVLRSGMLTCWASDSSVTSNADCLKAACSSHLQALTHPQDHVRLQVLLQELCSQNMYNDKVVRNQHIVIAK